MNTKAIACALLFPGLVGLWAQPATGLFEGHGDVGTLLHPGSLEYDSAKQIYTIKGSGENMWFGTDAFQFAWKRVSGDIDVTAEVQFPEKGGNAHRKGVLMLRQSLDADSVYADVAVHGDGLTSLQFREERGGNTHEVQANTTAPRRLRIEKRGDSIYMWVAGEGQDLRFAGGAPRIVLKAPFYAGIGVCSHDKDAVETALFSGVEISTPQAKDPALYSALETVPIASTDRRAVYTTAGRIEWPSWAADGQALLFHRGDKTERVGLTGGPTQPAAAGDEKPPAGEYTYAHSDKSGTMQIWRTRADGTEPVQVTPDDVGACYPQVSPDELSLAFLSFDKGLGGCPVDKEVTLRVMSLADRKTKAVATFTGGRGTLGSAAWSPDGKRLVYVSYHMVP